MALFLAINTSSVTLLPTGIIALRASAGSLDPAGILPSTLFATIVSTTVAITSVKLYQRFWLVPAVTFTRPGDAGADDSEPAAPASAADLHAGASEAYPGWVSLLVLAGIAALVPLTILYGKVISPWIIPGLMVALLAFGVWRKVPIYEVFVDGAKDGFQVALRIIPYLVAILVAVGMFRASGAMEWLVEPLSRITNLFGLPPEALSMALLRPLSGSGAYGIVASVIEDPLIGPDSYTGYLVSTLQGSTETTFYVIAVYFGAIQIRRIRHTLAAGLTADFAGVVAAVVICTILFA
jgi:spore maturation protein SpmB